MIRPTGWDPAIASRTKMIRMRRRAEDFDYERVGWVQRFDAEAMEGKAEGAPKRTRTRTDCEREEGHTRKEDEKSIVFSRQYERA